MEYQTKKDEINSLYESKEFLLEDWLEQYGTPELRQRFRKYLSHKEDEHIMDEIKESIKMMMYNKKTCYELQVDNLLYERIQYISCVVYTIDLFHKGKIFQN
ncbi:hypothetical protein 162319355 [Organic Lake phycodnavirus 2]|nr:hypothetical protein 162319355 [Organic Lake phycodnavirus 2]